MSAYEFNQRDASALGNTGLAGLLSGGFNFSPVRLYGGRGNSATSTPSTTATLTPTATTTPTATQPRPVEPWQEFGFYGGATTGTVSGVGSLVVPAILIGGFILLAAVLKK